MCKKTAILNFRIDSQLKEDSRSVLSANGLDHSKAIRYFLQYIANNKALPDSLESYINESK